MDALRPDNNVSDKAKSNLFIAPLFFRIKIGFEFPDVDARRQRLRPWTAFV
jgi:hypothetical protein